MKKLAFAAMAAIILVSAFVGLKTWTVKAANDNRMYFTPTEKVYDPPYGGPLDFLYELDINTTHANISEWEAIIVWNPKVVACLGVVWGTFMSGTPARNQLTNITNIYASGTGISLSQYYANQTFGTTGAGVLAYLHLTFILPGATSLTFLEASVWDDALTAYALDGQTGLVKSNLPHPEFWWWTYDDSTVNTTVTQHYGNGTLGNVSSLNHGANPLPQANINDGDRPVPYGTTVYFTANMSYDVTNMEWNGSAYKLNASGAGITMYLWDFGDGYGTNDKRIDTTTGYPNGSLVLVGATDAGTLLYPFKTKEKYYANLTGSGYVYHDPIIYDNNSNGKYDPINGTGWGDTILYNPNAIVIANQTTLKAFPANVMHTGVSTGFVAGNGIYTEMQLTTDVNYRIVSATSDMEPTHVYQAYKYPGYIVNLTTYDASGAYWSSTWRYGGIRDDDVVPMWRDVGIVSIWPSLVPFEQWDNGTGTSWYVPWWFNTVDFAIPQTNDPYWNYQMPDDWCDTYGIPDGSTVKQAWALVGDTGGDEGAGINICVTGNNYGSVRENTFINLYAAAVTFKLGGTSVATYAPLQVIDLEQIAHWSYKFAAGTYIGGIISPAGSGWSLVTNWMPQKNAMYLLFATVDTADAATMTDQDRSNNLFQLPSLLSNLCVGNFTGTTYNGLVSPVKTYWNYMCDIRNVGTQSTSDLAPMNQWLNSASNLWKTVIPRSVP